MYIVDQKKIKEKAEFKRLTDPKSIFSQSNRSLF